MYEVEVDIGAFLDTLLDGWIDRHVPDRRLLLAFRKASHADVTESLLTKPTGVRNMIPADFPHREQLVSPVDNTQKVLQTGILQYLSHHHMSNVPVVSPLAGGSADPGCPPSPSQGDPDCRVRIRTLNPGALGFSDMEGRMLWWRLWDVAAFGQQQNYHVMIIPGPRFPVGVSLPHGFAYVFLGAVGCS